MELQKYNFGLTKEIESYLKSNNIKISCASLMKFDPEIFTYKFNYQLWLTSHETLITNVASITNIYVQRACIECWINTFTNSKNFADIYIVDRLIQVFYDRNFPELSIKLMDYISIERDKRIILSPEFKATYSDYWPQD